jgi:uncharacterized repeat protein (TIGR01451 family)
MKNPMLIACSRSVRMRVDMLKVTLSGLLLLGVGSANADYVSTAVNRIFIDPASIPVITDGYQNGDVVAYVVETTPQITAGATNGAGAWSIVYIPAGVEVVGTELVSANPDGTYSNVPAKDLAPIANGCGNRGCAIADDLTNPDRYTDGAVAQNQQDTGIFFSTNARTALLNPNLSITPTGPLITPQRIYNQWDFDQILAFGSNTAPAPLSGNNGRGTTPLVSYGTNGPWFGTGSPVSGPDTYFTNDYNPACDPTAGTGTVAFRLDLGCVGPWNRIQYPNSKIAATGAVTPGVATTGTYPTNGVSAVATGAGIVVSTAAPLPATTNAVRFVQGARRVGDLEISRLTLRVTDATNYVAAINAGNKFCISSTGGDNVATGRGPQDNLWRYYEGNNHVCYNGDTLGVLLKKPKFVNGVASNGGTLSPSDIISYEITFTNTSLVTINNLVMSDVVGDLVAPLDLTLVAAGTAGCAYSSYNGTQGGLPTLSTRTSTNATWNALPTLAAGQSVTVFMCGQVLAGAALGTQIRNTGSAVHDTHAVPYTSSTLGTVSSRISGNVYNDVDGSTGLTPGDIGLAGVTVQLWDSTGTTLLATTITTSTGAYEFNGLAAGTYLIREIDPAGFFTTGDTQGSLTDNQISVTLASTTSASSGHNFFDRETAQLNVTKAVSPNPVSIGEQATYTVTIVNTGPVATTANIVINDTLPTGITYVSASGTNWTCNGLVPLTCTFTGTLAATSGSTTLLLLVNVGAGTLNGNNTARASGGGDTRCPAPPATALPRCSGTVIVGTVPVILSDVDVRVEGRELLVQFGTASEEGALGFKVHASKDTEANRQLLAAEMSVARASTVSPQRYQVRGAYSGQTKVWIEEISIRAGSTFYGPFAVGSRLGSEASAVRTDWAIVRAEQQLFRQAQQRIHIDAARGTTSAQAEVSVAESGWVRVRFEDLLAKGIDWTGVPAAHIELSRGDVRVPLEYSGATQFGPGSTLGFLAESVSASLYTRTAKYRLRVATAATPLLPVFGGVGALSPQTSVPARFEHAPNRQYGSASPIDDPWYAYRLVRNNTPSASINEYFALPEKAADSAGERIEVELWGGLDYAQAPDHSVRLLLNGVEIATDRFDGLTQRLVTADLPAGLLISGTNTLTLELVGDTELAADVVHLEAIRVDYSRALTAVEDRIEFSLPADVATGRNSADRVFVDDFDDGGSAACAQLADCVAYRVRGLGSDDAVVLRQRGGNIVRLTATTAAVPGGYELAFASSKQPGDRYWIEPRAGEVEAHLALAAPLADPLNGGPASYLIVSHPSFISALSPLIAARQSEGFTVRVVDVEAIYDFYNSGVVDPVAIQLALSEAYARLGTRYVLLVGGDTYDYFNYTFANSVSFVPTPYRVTGPFIRFGAADGVYADVDADGLADMALGRFPVRSVTELNSLIAKTLSYAQASHGGKAVLLSDRDQGGISYRAQLAPLANHLGAQWNVNTLSLQDYPSGGSAQARADLVTAVNSGQSLLAYLGHGSPGNWTFEGLLNSSQVYAGAFNNAGTPTLVWNIGCYGTYFVDPLYNTIAHGLLLQNNGGAAAVLGASGLTLVSSDVAWINTFGVHIASERIGDAVRMAQRTLQQAGPIEFRDLAVGGTLLGDPALRLNQ